MQPRSSPPFGRLLRRFAASRRSAISIVFAMLLPVVILCAGLMVDTVTWYREQAQLQFGIDASIMADAFLLTTYQGTLPQAAVEQPGIVNEAVTDATALGSLLGTQVVAPAAQQVLCPLQVWCANGGSTGVKIQSETTGSMSYQATRYFVGFAPGLTPLLTVTATAAIKQMPCITALDPTNDGTPLYGIYAQDAATITGTNCGVVADSIAPAGADPAITTVPVATSLLTTLLGGVSGLAPLVSDLTGLLGSAGSISGAYVSASGTVAQVSDGSIKPYPLSNGASQADPLAGLVPIIPSGCAFTAYIGLPTTTQTFTGATSTFCGPTVITGGHYTFTAGYTYFFEGDLTLTSASVSVAGSGGITFVVLGNLTAGLVLGSQITLVSAGGTPPGNGLANGAAVTAGSYASPPYANPPCGAFPLSACPAGTPAIPGVALWQAYKTQTQQVLGLPQVVSLSGINLASFGTTGLRATGAIEAPNAILAVFAGAQVAPTTGGASSGLLSLVARSIFASDAGTSITGAVAPYNSPVVLVQ